MASAILENAISENTNTPRGWRWVRLGDEAETTSGGTPSRNILEYYKGTIPWVKSGELTDSRIFRTGELITEKGLINSSAKIFPDGTLLIALYGATVGKLGILQISAATNQAVCGIFSNGDVQRDYLYYYLLAQRKHLIDKSAGGAQPNINQDIIRNLEVPLPSTQEEQKRIAAILDKADRLRRTRRYAQQLSDTFLQSVFVEMFGDALEDEAPTTLLGELVTISGGGTPSREVSSFYTGIIPWVTAKDMRGNYISDAQEYITEEAVRKSATKIVPVGSILVVVKSKVLMRRLPLAITQKALCHNQDLKSIQCSNALNPHFLFYVLRHNEPRLLQQARGANTEGLNLDMLEAVSVPNVPLLIQEKFACIVQRFEHLRAQQREAARQAEHLFQTLLHKAFTGCL